jgi:hypothetical protein
MITESNNQEYAKALSDWMESLTLTGASGRRAVFVERSLKRQNQNAIKNALEFPLREIPVNWQGTVEEFRFNCLWHLTVTISKKFKTTVPEEFKYRKTLMAL